MALVPEVQQFDERAAQTVLQHHPQRGQHHAMRNVGKEGGSEARLRWGPSSRETQRRCGKTPMALVPEVQQFDERATQTVLQHHPRQSRAILGDQRDDASDG